MRPEHLKYLRCPKSGAELILVDAEMENDRVKKGQLVTKDGYTYPIIKFIPRFVSDDNYAENFGFEWQVHARTQYDAEASHKLSEDRVFSVTRWDRDLIGDVILEAGSGSGRFTEHLLSTGAMVVSFDYSQAV